MSNNIWAQQKYSHWSLNLKGGVNRGEYAGGGIQDGKYGFLAGVEIERTFNPLWGILAEYEFNNYVVSDNLDGTGNEVTLQGSLNMANLVAKYRQGNWQRLNAYARLGAGFSFYNTQNMGTTIVVPAVAALEYNINKYLAVGVTGEHRWYTSSSMGFDRTIQDRPVEWAALANLRIKFCPVKNPHARNTKLTDYEAVYASKENTYDDAPLKQAISKNQEAIRQMQEQLNETNNDLNKANNELNKTKEELEKCCAEKSVNSSNFNSNAFLSEQNIEFDLNSYVIWPIFYPALDALVAKLKQQPNIKLTLFGYTDSSGSESLNQELSLQRANSVAKYLQNKGIDSKRITTKGMSATHPVASNETEEGRQQNRRVEFEFSK